MTGFYAFNPRAVRMGLLAGAAGCAAIVAWALVGATQGLERYGEARAGVAAGLLFAFLYAFWRLRPREGWGVRVEPTRLVLSRPFSPQPLELLKSHVEEIRRDGKRQDTVTLYLENAQRWVVNRVLFPSSEAFDACARALLEWKPPRALDA